MDSNGKTRKQTLAPVTVVIPCYCCANTIERAVISVVNQTMPPKEIILVDDGSQDAGKTAGALREIQRRSMSDVTCKILTMPCNRGQSAARNAGWDSATEPFVAFLDADDAWHPKKLEIQYKWMDKHPRAALTGHPPITKHEETGWEKLPDRWEFWQVSAWRLLIRNRFPTRSVMLRRTVEFRFDPSKRYAEDYLLWLEIMMAGHEAWRVELPLACSYKPDFGVAGLSADLWRMERGELKTYKHLYERKHIRLLALWGLMLWSLLRYFRRILSLPLQNNWILKR